MDFKKLKAALKDAKKKGYFGEAAKVSAESDLTDEEKKDRYKKMKYLKGK